MLIEIAGIPGSGKTTLFKHLCAELVGRNAAVTDLSTLATEKGGADTGPRFVRRKPDRDLLFRFTRFTARHPAFFATADRAFGDATTKKFLFFLLAAQFQMARDLGRDDEVIFMDEGFLSHSVAMYPDAAARPALHDMIDVAPPVDALIFIDTPADIAFERVVARQSGRHDFRARTIQKFGDAAAFSERRQNFLAGVELYRQRCGATRVVTPGAPVQSTAGDLADWLVSLKKAG